MTAESDLNIRAYGVWVSEIMLQQASIFITLLEAQNALVYTDSHTGSFDGNFIKQHVTPRYKAKSFEP